MEKEAFDARDMTILIVDDEPRIRDFVRMNLELERYRVIEAGNGLEALEQLRENLPDLIVIDVMMPEMDGFETLRHIREVSNVPVIMLTVRQSEQDKIHGLDLGADDYIAKPFSPRELLSRTRALLRRSFMAAPARKTEIIADPDLKIDFSRREVIARGEKGVLRPTENRLLYPIVSNCWLFRYPASFVKIHYRPLPDVPLVRLFCQNPLSTTKRGEGRNYREQKRTRRCCFAR